MHSYRSDYTICTLRREPYARCSETVIITHRRPYDLRIAVRDTAATPSNLPRGAKVAIRICRLHNLVRLGEENKIRDQPDHH